MRVVREEKVDTGRLSVVQILRVVGVIQAVLIVSI